ncbi:c-type cytochrome [Noviherbaspirillum sp. DKR-6]|uniref:C-type cytochrome n=2 Tax=Noviherbaspirillum pedocola TaxID=2801341 RepID=A0A934SS93_9BURK|nr:c-type cytochrome [Noviherbaspirillum pedocola]
MRGAACLALCLAALAARAEPDAGEDLYRRGTLGSGAPIKAVRAGGGEIAGREAACVNCHRKSGLGGAEGRFVIPPITAKYLFRPRGMEISGVDQRYGTAWQPGAEPYDEAGLARAIREGRGRDGRALNALMPRFAIDDADMAALTSYLRGLSAAISPGVSADTLHFATIVTPDADPARRAAMLSVLENFFSDKNAFIRGGMRPMHTAKTFSYRVTRKWALHVWQLTGAPSDWEDQLERHLAEEPVFAVVSGLGGREWAPVHRFCQRQAVPCLFPNVDLPVVAEGDDYNLYFSKAVLLEAQLLARAVAGNGGAGRLVQVYRDGDIGAQAATVLEAAAGVAQALRPIAAGAGDEALARALADVGPDDAVALWLRPEDMRRLPARFPGRLALVSGLMAGLEHAPLPDAWRARTLMAYPFDLPEQRRVRMDFPLGWFSVRGIAVTDERLQSDTWLACRILSESLGDMGDNFYRDYLVEQTEAMLSRRLVNAYYPRLGLAPGQRFASKGGYLLRFDGARPVPAGEWIVP